VQDGSAASAPAPELKRVGEESPAKQEEQRTASETGTEQTDDKREAEATQQAGAEQAGAEQMPSPLPTAVQRLLKRDGWGQEDMMLMALLLLMHGEEDNGQGQGELFRLLLLLLFLT
jgi:hypothetical protein